MIKIIGSLICFLFSLVNLSGVDVDDFEAKEYTSESGEQMNYRLFVPDGYDPSKSYPLVVFLHGIAEGGTDNRRQLVVWPAAMVFAESGNQAHYPCFMMAPQNQAGRTWGDARSLGLVDGIVEAVRNEFAGVDLSRIYITGISDGGTAALASPQYSPGRYAGGIPVGGAVPFRLEEALMDWPFWAFVGGRDVRRTELETLMDEIQDFGGSSRYGVYPGRGHLIWNPGVYAEPELIPWLFQFRIDPTPSTAPKGLHGTAVSDRIIRLEWEAAVDDESIVLEYRIFRNGELAGYVTADELGAAAPTFYDDYTVEENSVYSYSVLAINAGNIKSELSASVDVASPPDTTAPVVEFIGGGRKMLRVIFNEKVDITTATNPNNYSLSDGVTVESANALEGQKAVALSISPLSLGRSITLTVRNIQDIAVNPNAIDSSGVERSFDNIPFEHLALWIKSDEGIVVGEEGGVSRYTDHSEKGFSQSQKVPGQRPILLPSQQNGKPTLEFDGIRQHLSLPKGFSDFTSGTTAIIVAKSLGINTEEKFFDLGIAGQARPWHNIRFGRDALSSNLSYQVFDGMEPGEIVIGGGALQEDQLGIFSVTHEGGTAGVETDLILYANSMVVGSGQARVPRIIDRSNNYVGRMNPVDVSSRDGQFQGEIGEFLLFRKELSKQDRQEIEQYLYNKYFGDGMTNRAPVVDVQVPSDIQFPSTEDAVRTVAKGIVTDDDLPFESIVVTRWSLVSGPAQISFEDINNLLTEVIFYEAGEYVVRLTADDGELSGHVDVRVNVHPVDVTPPELDRVSAGGNHRRIVVAFSEAVDSVTAEDVANYVIDDQVTIFMADLLSDGTRVILSVSPLTEDTDYTLTVNGVLDLAANPSNDFTSFVYTREFLSDDFGDGDFDSWTIVDEGTTEGSSVWRVVWGELRESSNIGSSDPNEDGRLGTFVYYDEETAFNWNEYELTALIRSQDDDGIGVMFHYQDPDNYYRVEVDQQRKFRKLIQKVNGVVTLLAHEAGGYTVGQEHVLSVAVSGRDITVSMDGNVIFGGPVVSDALSQGTVGLYAWRSSEAYFDNIVVTSIGKGLVGRNLSRAGFSSMAVGSDSSGFSWVFDDGSWEIGGSGLGIYGIGTPASSMEYSLGKELLGLPFFEDFDDMVFRALDGQNNWTAEGNPEPILQTETVFEGRQALEIAAERSTGRVSASNHFPASTSTEVWANFYLKPVPTSDWIIPGLNPGTTVGFYFGEDGRLRIFDGGIGDWEKVSAGPPVSFSDWERITIYQNYESQAWSLWLNGVRVSQNVSFANSVPSFTKFKVSNETLDPTYIDSIEVTDLNPSGLNQDDEIYFEHQSVDGGFDLSVRVKNLVSEHSTAQAGLMMREGTAGSDRFVSVSITSEDQYVLGGRLSSGSVGRFSILPGTFSSADVWVRLRRSGDEVFVYTSGDGELWVEHENVAIVGFRSSTEVGLFVSSGNFSVQPAIATFVDFQLDPIVSKNKGK